MCDQLLNSISNMKLEMAYALCDEELQSAETFKFQPLFLGMFYTHTFQYMDFDIRIELNMCFTFVVIVTE